MSAIDLVIGDNSSGTTLKNKMFACFHFTLIMFMFSTFENKLVHKLNISFHYFLWIWHPHVSGDTIAHEELNSKQAGSHSISQYRYKFHSTDPFILVYLPLAALIKELYGRQIKVNIENLYIFSRRRRPFFSSSCL